MRNFIVRQNCILCDSAEITEFFCMSYENSPVAVYTETFYADSGKFERDKLCGVNYILAKCDRCGFIFQKIIPNPSFMSCLYEEWIEPSWAYRMEFQGDIARQQLKVASWLMRMIRSTGKPSTEIRILDFGMGWCRWLNVARAFGCQVFGLELSPARIAFAEKNGITIVGWDQLNGREFDIINCDQVLEHLENPVEALKKMSSVLSKSGIIQIGVPNGANIETIIGGYNWKIESSGRDLSKRKEILDNNPIMPAIPLQHINVFTNDTLRMLLEKASLRPCKISLINQLSSWTAYGEGVKGLARIALSFVAGQRFGTTIYAAREDRYI